MTSLRLVVATALVALLAPACGSDENALFDIPPGSVAGQAGAAGVAGASGQGGAKGPGGSGGGGAAGTGGSAGQAGISGTSGQGGANASGTSGQGGDSPGGQGPGGGPGGSGGLTGGSAGTGASGDGGAGPGGVAGAGGAGGGPGGSSGSSGGTGTAGQSGQAGTGAAGAGDVGGSAGAAGVAGVAGAAGVAGTTSAGGAGSAGSAGASGASGQAGSGPVSPCPEISGRDVQYSALTGHCYWVESSFISKNDWSGRRDSCKKNKGDLVAINSAEENAFVRSLHKGEMWIGATDGKGAGDPGPGTYKWSNGEPMTYTSWAPGEPNAAKAGFGSCPIGDINECYEHCGVQKEDGNWNDTLCNSTNEAICEFVPN